MQDPDARANAVGANEIPPGWLRRLGDDVGELLRTRPRWWAAIPGNHALRKRACGCGSYTVKGEIKNVITAVAKTTHYWRVHLPPEVQQSIALEQQIRQWKARMLSWLR